MQKNLLPSFASDVGVHPKWVECPVLCAESHFLHSDDLKAAMRAKVSALFPCCDHTKGQIPAANPADSELMGICVGVGNFGSIFDLFPLDGVHGSCLR